MAESNRSGASSGADGSRVHVCSVCDKSFTLKHNLHKHIKRVHENYRPFHCHQCDKKFSTKYDLKRHMITHNRTLSNPQTPNQQADTNLSQIPTASSVHIGLQQSRTPVSIAPPEERGLKRSGTQAPPHSPCKRQLEGVEGVEGELSSMDLDNLEALLEGAEDDYAFMDTLEAEEEALLEGAEDDYAFMANYPETLGEEGEVGVIEDFEVMDRLEAEEREGGELALIAHLPDRLKDLYRRHWDSIKTHTRRGIVVTTLTVLWDPLNPTPNWDRHLLEEFDRLQKRFKINFSHSLILEHKETGEFSFFHASANNNAVLERPRLISDKKGFLDFVQSLKHHDLLEHVKQQRPSTKFAVVCIPSTSFYFYHMRDFPIGCLQDDVPEFLRNNPFLHTLQRAPKHCAYNDNLCFFRCLALHEGLPLEGLEHVAKNRCMSWIQRKRMNPLDTFPGVKLEDIRELERLFRTNIEIFEFQFQAESPVLVPRMRSEFKYEKTMHLLLYKQHFMFIKDINKLGCAMVCEKCDKIWRCPFQLNRHQKSCTGLGSRVWYSGGVYTPPTSIVEELAKSGLSIAEDYVFPYRATFDFEVYFETDDLPSKTKQTLFTARHIPLSVAVASNVPGFILPKCFVTDGDPCKLVGDMVGYLLAIADSAFDKLKLEFKEVLDELEERGKQVDEFSSGDEPYAETLRKRFIKYLKQLPVVGFNSGKYDVNVIKPYLVQHLLKEDSDESHGVQAVTGDDEDDEVLKTLPSGPFVVKRNNQYICISTDRLRFLDILNYLAPGFSYQKYLTAFGVKEKKSFFPYEYITGLDKLNETRLPPHENFYSNLKKSNITVEDYDLCKKIWRNKNMTTLKDFLIDYNIKDVRPFLEALEKQISIYSNLGVDLLKDGLSVPGITLKYLFKTMTKKKFFTLFNDAEKDMHSLIRDNITGGPSLIFHRYHRKDETFIRGVEEKPCKRICGYDANALYLSALMKDMPTGIPTFRKKENNFKAERRHWCGQMAREWIEWTSHKRGMYIQHQFNEGERMMGKRKIKVDGYDPKEKTVYQFHGCIWHGHKCPLTSGMTHNPFNHKPFEELAMNTDSITRYLRKGLNLKVIEMRECEWKQMKNNDPAIVEFVNMNIPPHPTTVKMSEAEILKRIRDGTLFGMVQCDIKVPEHLEDYFSELQPIFKNTEVGLDDIGEHMKEYAKSKNLLTHPRRTLVGSFYGDQILMTTPLLKWYMIHGLVVSNVTTVIEYEPYPCFKYFGERVTEARRGGDVNPSQMILAETFKLLGNSAYGKTLTNIGKFRDVKFTTADQA